MSIVYLSEDSLKTRLIWKMSKKRKTRNQKILADHRHILYHLETTSAAPSHSAEKNLELQPKLTPQATKQSSYAYVLTDVKKTSFITFSILTMQVILFFLMKKM